MNDQKNNPTEPENDDLNDLLKALNDDSKPEPQAPLNQAEKEDSDDELSGLRDLFSDDIERSERHEDKILIDQTDDLDDMLSALIEPVGQDSSMIQEQPSIEESSPLDEQGSDELDSRFREMISESDEPTTDIVVEKIVDLEPAENDELIVTIGEEEPQKVFERSPSQAIPETETPKQKADQTEGDIDLDELKQYIQFDDKSSKEKRKTIMDRLNSDTPRKDPIALAIFAILAIILVALLVFIGFRVASDPAWHPTPVPTSTLIIDPTEVYISNLNFSGTTIHVQPSGNQLSEWNPIENEALIIPGSYFCRLIYLNQNTEVFATVKLEQSLFVNMSNGEPWQYKITEIATDNFEVFKNYVDRQQDCVAIFIADADRILLLERVRSK